MIEGLNHTLNSRFGSKRMDTQTQPEQLVDNFGRHVDYVRISVTDRCDFRCVYCMSEDMEFVPRARILTLEELAQISRAFVELGVKRIRITGGEPLVRRDVVKLMSEVAALDGLDETTLLQAAADSDPRVRVQAISLGERRLGKSAAFMEADCFDAEGNLVARATATAIPMPFKRL